MSWQSVLIKATPIPKRNKAMMKVGNAVTVANATDSPAKIPEDISPSNLKTTINRLLKDLQQYEDDEFSQRFKNLHWDEADKEDLIRILNDMLQNLPDESYILDKVKAFLEGNHDDLLAAVDDWMSKDRGMKSKLKTWNRNNGNKLLDYLKDKPELAEKMSSIFEVPLSVESLKIANIEGKNLDGEFMLEYLTMLLNDVKISVNQKIKYLPDGKKNNTLDLYGMGAGKNRLPRALEYFLNNENLNIDSFMTKSDIKTSTKKEVVFSRLNSDAFVDGEYEELQIAFNDANKNPREFERNLSARQKRQFKKLWDEEQVSALKYAIPAHVYDKMKEGQWDGVMENYRIYDPDDLDEFLEEHGEAFGRMKLNEKLGMYKVGSREDVKELQQLFQNDGALIPYSSMEESGGALEAYLNRLSNYEGSTDTGSVFSKVSDLHGLTHQQTSLHSLIGTMRDIENAYEQAINIDVDDIVIDYIEKPSEETQKKVEGVVSESTYKEIRDALIDQLSMHIKKMGTEGDENLMHRKPNVVEPLVWLREKLE